jgi:flagellar assembly factor FliW
MPVTFESIRFGTVEIAQEDVIEFPFGLIGLGGLHYALIDRNPGTGFLWLHSVEEPGLALPVVSPYQFFSTFSLQMATEDRERTGIENTSAAMLYVTVRATPNPLDITANLRAPLVIQEGRGYQVINTNADAPLQAPLFTLAEQPPVVSARAAGEGGQPAVTPARAAGGPTQPDVAPEQPADAA